MFGAGFASGLLGIGSGAFKVVALDNYMKLPIKVSTATSNFMMGVTATASALIYFFNGTINPAIAAPIALGTLIGSRTGAKVMQRLDAKYIRYIFLPILLFTIIVVISNILRCGVYISSALILIGIFLGLVKGVESSLTLERYSFNQMFNGLVEFDYYAYLMFGIFILILTPIFRILGLLFVYLQEKDYNFVRICLIVLVILIISLTLGVKHN